MGTQASGCGRSSRACAWRTEWRAATLALTLLLTLTRCLLPLEYMRVLVKYLHHDPNPNPNPHPNPHS